MRKILNDSSRYIVKINDNNKDSGYKIEHRHDRNNKTADTANTLDTAQKNDQRQNSQDNTSDPGRYPKGILYRVRDGIRLRQVTDTKGRDNSKK